MPRPGVSRSGFAPRRPAPRSRASLLGTTALATSLTLFIGSVPALAGQRLVLPSGGSSAKGSVQFNNGTGATLNRVAGRSLVTACWGMEFGSISVSLGY